MAFTFERRDEQEPISTHPPRQNQDRLAVPKPLYSQVRDMLARQISAGTWRSGTLLPNEGTLAQQFGVSIGTIRRAVEGLEDIGIVVRRQGRGTFVTGIGGTAMNHRLCRLSTKSGERLGSTRVVYFSKLRAASALEALRLALRDSSEVLELQLIVRSGASPIGLERHVVPAALVPSCRDNLDTVHDIQTLLGEAGYIIAHAEEAVSTAAADATDSAVLGIAEGQALLQIERRSIALDDTAVELGVCRYLPTDLYYTSNV